MSSPQRRSGELNMSSARRSSDDSLPLNLTVAWILIKLFPIRSTHDEPSVYSGTFVSGVLSVVCREVFELCPVSSGFDALRSEVDALLRTECGRIRRSNNKARKRGVVVSDQVEAAETFESWLGVLRGQFEDIADGCTFIDGLGIEIRDRVTQLDEHDLPDAPEPIDRRSPLGLFLRGVMLTLKRLSFDDTTHLSRRFAQWMGIPSAGSSRRIELVANIGSLNRKAAMEDTFGKRLSAMQDYRSAAASADYSKALASLRRFYDYHFPSTARGQHQHALLNLANFHYSTGGMDSAKSAADEAIRVARAAGDSTCLQQCMTLLQRLNVEMSSSNGPRQRKGMSVALDTLPKHVSATDELWSLRAALDMGEPIPMAFRRISTALARSLPPPKTEETRAQLGWVAERPQNLAAWHAAQAGLWAMIGSETLAEVHEDLALGVDEIDDDARWTILISRSWRALESARYGDALSTLLEADPVEGMSEAEYRRWAYAVWEALQHRADLSDDPQSASLLASLRPPEALSSRNGPGGLVRAHAATPTTTSPSPSTMSNTQLAQDRVRSSLRIARKLLSADSPPHLVLPHVLFAAEIATSLALWPAYRLATVLLAEVFLRMDVGLEGRAIELVSGVWEGVAAARDEETRAMAGLVLGRAELQRALALHDESSQGIGEAKQHIELALHSAQTSGSRQLVLQSTALLALIADLESSGESERNQLAQEWQKARTGDEAALSAAREQIKLVGEMIKLVGVRVAEGWA